MDLLALGNFVITRLESPVTASPSQPSAKVLTS